MAERLRVCVVTEGFYPEMLGGMEVHGYRLAEKLYDLGVECEVLARPVRPETPPVQQVGRILVRHLGVPGQFKGMGPKALLPLGRFVARYSAWLQHQRPRFDAALVLGSKTTPIPGLVAGLLRGLPFVIAPQSSFEFVEPISAGSVARGGRALKALLGPWQRFRAFMLGRAAAVVAISDEMERGLKALGLPAERIVRIPNGMDADRFHPAAPAEKPALRARLGLPAEKAIFVFVGRLSRAKGVVMLTELWADVVRAHPDAHLVLVGEGSGSFDDCEAELRAVVAEKGLAAAVTMTGRVDDVPAFLQAADVFVFPSDYEGFSVALLEGMACGLPLIATAVGGAVEVVKEPEHGRLIPPKDPAALRQAIEDLFARRAEWPAMGAAVSASVIGTYSMDAIAARYAEVLRRAAGRP